MQNNSDFLIVGHGLAGALLAQQLLHLGQSVRVIDNEAPQSASRVAAGIINPVTGHRLNITEGFTTFYPNAVRTYQRLEAQFQQNLFTPREQLRLIKNQGQFEFYEKRRQDTAYADIFGDYITKPLEFPNSKYGALNILQSAVVAVNTLLEASKEALKEANAYCSGEFQYDQLRSSEAGLSYQNSPVKNIIFCEGYAAHRNPWLCELPFKPAKGEVLDIQISQENKFLNWGNWLIPGRVKGTARLGSTYEWQDLSLAGTQSSKLMANLLEHTGVEAQLLKSSCGVRPTTVHRTPFIGRLSKLSNAYCFNGFGSKGCLIIPHYAELLVKHILESTALPEELQQWL